MGYWDSRLAGIGARRAFGGVGKSSTMEMRVMTDSKRRKGLMAASALVGGVLALSACSGNGSQANGAEGGGGKSPQAQVDEAAAQKTSEALIKIAPKDGSDNSRHQQRSRRHREQGFAHEREDDDRRGCGGPGTDIR